MVGSVAVVPRPTVFNDVQDIDAVYTRFCCVVGSEVTAARGVKLDKQEMIEEKHE